MLRAFFQSVFRRPPEKNLQQPTNDPPPGSMLLREAPELSMEELIRRCRIVVIDDKKTEFPFSLLEKEGYAITYWKDVNELSKLESGYFDIIVLDIGGVGSKLDPDAEGAGVLRHLKQECPSQIVIAYSGQSHDPARIPFFRMADQFVPKPANVLTWKEVLNSIMREKMSVRHYWGTAEALLRSHGVPAQRLAAFEKAILESATASNTKDSKEVVIKSLGTAVSVAELAKIVGKIYLLFQGAT